MSETTNQATGVWRAGTLSPIHAAFGLSIVICLVMAIMSLGL